MTQQNQQHQPVEQDYQWLKTRLDSIDGKVGAIQTSLAAADASRIADRDKITALESTVFGNGKEGLKVRVDRLEREKNTIKRSSIETWIVRIAAGAGWFLSAGILLYATFCK
ncbi:hypothetical protein [Trichococcus shcherbakoviae]|uniref:hypothetical protein n=1 Tax=Trichococcus shcherbakoviae TaxID=2094020 RepID=UPI002AA7AFB2|nr:hypothetical protein [Trichococcus shcherbakoviae]